MALQERLEISKWGNYPLLKVNRTNYSCWHVKYLFHENSTQFSPLPAPDWWAPSGADAAWRPPPSLWSHVAHRSPPKVWTCVLHAAHTKQQYTLVYVRPMHVIWRGYFCLLQVRKEAKTNHLLLISVQTSIWKMGHYHAAPKGTLVTDALLTGPAENTQLLMVVLTSAINHNNKPAAEQKLCWMSASSKTLCCAEREKITAGAAPHLSLSLSSCLVRLQSCRVSNCWVTSSAHRQLTSSLSCSGALNTSNSTLTLHTTVKMTQISWPWIDTPRISH